jgi:hypothetical protein
MSRVQEKSDGRVRRSAVRMFFGEAHELVRDAPQRVQLKWMLARARLEELIKTLLKIDRGRARHVIEVITLSIP